jgi:DNA-binding beta-propeller fold protein YncE
MNRTFPVTSLALGRECLYVTGSHAKGFLSCINPANGKQVYKTPMPVGVTAVTLSPDGSRLRVCNRDVATVSEVDARSWESW